MILESMTGILDSRGEAEGRLLFQEHKFNVYVPVRDRGIDIVVTPGEFGSGRQIEVQVKYSEQVYCDGKAPHYSFGVTSNSRAKYSKAKHSYFLFLGKPLIFSKGTAEKRRSTSKRTKREMSYLVPAPEVIRVMTNAKGSDRLGIDMGGHPWIGMRPMDSDWTSYRFQESIREIAQGLHG